MKTRMTTGLALLALFVITLVTAQGAKADDGQWRSRGNTIDSCAMGPLSIVGQSPLQTLRLDMVPSRHTILGYGQMEFSLSNAWTNRWNNTPSFLIDLEMIQNVFAFSIGVGNDNELGFSIPVLTRTGGGLDRFIVKFHDVLNLDQEGRNEYPYDMVGIRQYNIHTGEWETVLDNTDQKTAMGDLSVKFRSQLYRGGGRLRSVLMTALMRLPTSTDRIFYGTGGIDAAFSLSTAHYLRPLFVYTTLGYSVYGSGNIMGVDLSPYQWTLFAAVEWHVSGSFSLIVQQMSNSGVAEDYYDFSQPTHELLIGAKQRVSDRLTLEYGVVENLFIYENSVDFGLSVGLTYRP